MTGWCSCTRKMRTRTSEQFSGSTWCSSTALRRTATAARTGVISQAGKRKERPSVPNEIKLLDHGYLKFIEHCGSDERIIESARMSTNKGFLGWGPRTKKNYKGQLHTEECASWALEDTPQYQGSCNCNPTPGDEKLLKYLYENKHSTPFEMAGLIIEVQAPIFVFREWHRHRTQSYNELSARYTPLPDLNYIPTIERLMLNSKSNKQAGVVAGAAELDAGNASIFQHELRAQYEAAQKLYEWALQSGVPKELARVHLPVGRYSRMRASANLRNWLQFLTLRMAPNAQWEIRQYANAVGTYIQELYPRTWELFVEGDRQ